MTEKSMEDRLADEKDLAWMLTTRPMLTLEELVARGGNPEAADTLRLCAQDGPLFPAFQYDEGGQLLEKVAETNRLLMAATDPLGAAEWWLNRACSIDRSAGVVNADLATDPSLSWMLILRAGPLANGAG